jgi:hypothetical protein
VRIHFLLLDGACFGEAELREAQGGRTAANVSLENHLDR